MRIGVFGVGAVGSIVGGLLTKAGRDVTLIDQWPQNVEKMRAEGLRLGGTCGDHVVPVRAIHLHELQGVTRPFDAVFIAVKSYDTDWTTQLASGYLAEGGYAVDFQNGINDERVARIIGRERTLGCVITMLCGMYEPAHAMRTDRGQVAFKIGELDGRDTERAQALSRMMNDVGNCLVTTNLWGERWSKLAVNCMANPLAALSGLGSAEVRSQAAPRRVAIHLAAEAILVGRAHGHEVAPIHGIAAQRFVDAAKDVDREGVERDMAAAVQVLTGGRPSMLQDVMRKRRTEIEFINGHVSREGKRVGVATPFNDKIVELILAAGVGTLQPTPRNLDPLVRMLPSDWRRDLEPALAT